VYSPLLEMEPAPALTSPPLTFQLTEAAPPLFKAAKNCSTAVPELLTVLQPVQLVSMVAEPGVIENVPFEDVPVAVPPHPASRTKIGTAPATSTRVCQRPSNFKPYRGLCLSARRLREGKPGLCGSVVAAVPWLNLPGAFLVNVPARPLLDVVRSLC